MAGYADDGRRLVEPKDAAAWRRWLERNGESSAAVWLVYPKRVQGKRDLSYDEAVEEALCFGWIDSTVKSLDDERHRQLFSKRKARSTWAASNKERVARLMAEGRMTSSGQAMIDVAKANGMWTALDAIERLEIPDDLRAALAGSRAAGEAFDGFSPSSKKAILWWIASAKKDETRATRVRETARLAALGIKANHPEAKGR